MVLTYLSGLSAAQTESISPTSSVPCKQTSNQKRRKTFTITLPTALFSETGERSSSFDQAKWTADLGISFS